MSENENIISNNLGIQGTEQWSDTQKHTQVYLATHDGAGNRLPPSVRSFISFSFGGKYIEDFNLLVVVDKDRMERNILPDFSNNITDSSIFDGQIFWSSHYKAGELSLTLATDGMTEKNLNDFKNWFYIGHIEPLILMEYPNRQIYARIAEAPKMQVLPFKEEKETIIDGTTYTYNTTIYKGTINFKFVMDEPYWEAISNNYTISHNSETILGETISWTEFDLPNNDIFNRDSSQWSNDIINQEIIKVINEDELTLLNENNNSQNSSSVNLDYHGTYTGLPQLTLKFNLKYDQISPSETNVTTRGKYILWPENGIQLQLKVGQNDPICTTTLTMPNIIYSYNQAIKIVYDGLQNNKAIIDIRNEIRDNIKHYAIRNYFLFIIDYYYPQYPYANSYGYFRRFWCIDNLSQKSIADASQIESKCCFTLKLDSRTQLATLSYNYNQPTDYTDSSIQNWICTSIAVTDENANDMLQSEFLTFPYSAETYTLAYKADSNLNMPTIETCTYKFLYI